MQGREREKRKSPGEDEAVCSRDIQGILQCLVFRL